MDDLLRKKLVRSYYFAEAMAFYELYYTPLVEAHAPSRERLTDTGRQADHPLTWVPLVFHCTSLQEAEEILADGFVKVGDSGTTSLTELPLGELDRMKNRRWEQEQVAIGFPRRYLQHVGFAPVLYLQSHPQLREVVRSMRDSRPEVMEALEPYVEENDDVAALNEIRTSQRLHLESAVWLLTTRRTSGLPAIPGIGQFRESHGGIATSFWHRTHQLDVLGEWQYVRTKRSENGELLDFEFIGEHYWRERIKRQVELSVWLPKRRPKLLFEMCDSQLHGAYEGPYRFIDVAKKIREELTLAGDLAEQLLPYRLIDDFDATAQSTC